MENKVRDHDIKSFEFKITFAIKAITSKIDLKNSGKIYSEIYKKLINIKNNLPSLIENSYSINKDYLDKLGKEASYYFMLLQPESSPLMSKKRHNKRKFLEYTDEYYDLLFSRFKSR